MRCCQTSPRAPRRAKRREVGRLASAHLSRPIQVRIRHDPPYVRPCGASPPRLKEVTLGLDSRRERGVKHKLMRTKSSDRLDVGLNLAAGAGKNPALLAQRPRGDRKVRAHDDLERPRVSSRPTRHLPQARDHLLHSFQRHPHGVPPVCHGRCPLQGTRRIGREVDWGMRFLDGFGLDDGPGNMEVSTVKLDRITGPNRLEHLEKLVRAPAQPPGGDTHGVVLILGPPLSEPDAQAAS